MRIYYYQAYSGQPSFKDNQVLKVLAVAVEFSIRASTLNLHVLFRYRVEAVFDIAASLLAVLDTKSFTPNRSIVSANAPLSLKGYLLSADESCDHSSTNE